MKLTKIRCFSMLRSYLPAIVILFAVAFSCTIGLLFISKKPPPIKNVLKGGKLYNFAVDNGNYFCERIYPALKNYLPDAFTLFKNVKFKKASDMYVYRSGDVVSNVIMEKGVWEKGDTDNILRVMNKLKAKFSKPPIFIDVGGNIGWFSMILNIHGFPILAFEPNPVNELLHRCNICKSREINLHNAPEWTLFPVGLGSSSISRPCEVVYDPNNLGNGGLYCDPVNPKGLLTLNVVTLDDVFTDDVLGKVPVGVVKIDVEGFELFILEGGKNFFTNHVPYVKVEMISLPGAIERSRIAFQYLKSYGFNFSLVDFEGPIGPDDFLETEQKIFDTFWWNKVTLKQQDRKEK